MLNFHRIAFFPLRINPYIFDFIHPLLLGNPCDGNYQHLDQSDRPESFTSSTDKCDDDDITDWNIWYRVSGSAGNALASKNPPPIKSCGTEVPVYLKDDHPDFDDGEKTLSVCTVTQSSSCFVERNIQVINCGAFYLYNLVRIRPCNPSKKKWRYCTNGQGKHKKISEKSYL